MAVNITKTSAEYLQAVVDMGSNGIRFSISSLQPPTARIMPTLYQHREAISLYDAQWKPGNPERQTIDDNTIAAVVASFAAFKRTCVDFEVPTTNITVLATEATRTAPNSEEFRDRIKEAVGWDVIMLAKEDEGRVGAMGVASSLPTVSGLVMDLGGGSTQLSWLIKDANSDEVRMPNNGSISMPYGAAAMTRRLAEAEKAGTTAELKAEVQKAVKDAYANLNVPTELQETARSHGGFTLYLSGGGFRGWGYVLMSQHNITPYLIPVINGFKADRQQFLGTEAVKEAAAATLTETDDAAEIFRVSDRRASQVPAVAFLVSALAQTLPDIKEVRFCQGGVREGHLFTKLLKEVRAQHPLVVATEPYDTANTSGAITKLLLSALPKPDGRQNQRDVYSDVFTSQLLDAFANLIYYHSSHSKDLQASSAIRSTTTGILASVHGVLHENRTFLALLLCQRWGGNVPPSDSTFKKGLEAMVESPYTLWWINYLGSIASLIASVYPAGVSEHNAGRVGFDAAWDESGKGEAEIKLQVVFAKDVRAVGFEKEVHGVEKVGKKKRWVGGRDGVGYKIAIELRDDAA
ncbi:retrograde regulation protein 2 [Recurvomyces mirabilis]|uniref:Retrograde regulation protein 2 n=1 Tax=Recurvomyces mirabilis TaxID=574656 RepID=A0AAE0WG06_9PEZI|nr:retrograde regulation protein 2 [Recurvomyces mirabilis]KAK5151708.1 retrograde regulation protein 2 [Recurvomyces mirabilis]